MTTYIITDTSACLTPELLAKNSNIKVVPFTIIYPDGSTELDLPGMDRSKLYASLKGPGFNYFGKLRYRPKLPDKLPGTTQPNASEYAQVYEQINPTDKAFTVTIAKPLSGSYNSAVQAAEGRSNIQVIDSASASMGQGLIVLALAELARQKDRFGETLSLSETEKLANDLRSRYVLLQTMTTLRYLERNGRIGKAKVFLAEKTDTLPIISVDKTGKVIAAGKAKGKGMLLAAFAEMVELAAKKIGNRPFTATFTHAEIVPGATGVEHLQKMVHDRFGNQVTGTDLIVPQNSVLLPHTGPDTYGMMLLPKK
jgi:DegV family protein with EDD domain